MSMSTTDSTILRAIIAEWRRLAYEMGERGTWEMVRSDDILCELASQLEAVTGVNDMDEVTGEHEL